MTLATKEWVISLVKKVSKKLGATDKPNNGLDNVLYVNEKPIMALDNINIYVNGTTGSDETGNGTETNPYKTHNPILKYAPHDLNGFEMNIYAAGNFSERFHLKSLSNGLVGLNFVDSPTLDGGLEIRFVDSLAIRGNVSIKLDPGTISYMGAIMLWHATVFIESGIMNIKGVRSSTLFDRGIYISHNSALYAQSWWTSKININTFQVGLCCQDCSQINIYPDRITYSNVAQNHEYNGGGTITST